MSDEAIQRMLGGPATAGLLYTAVELGLPDRLAAEVSTVDDLAADAGAHPDTLARILRALAGVGIVTGTPATGFRLTPLGAPLRRDGSAHHAARLLGHPVTQLTWAHLPRTALTGEPAFDHAHGMDFMQYLTTHPDYADRFNRFMSAITDRVAESVARGYDFDDAKTIVDVGGGAGALMRAVLRANPHMSGTVVDLSGVREQAEAAIAADGLSDRCRFLAGDFFTEVPPGADVYLLKSVLHDWDDDRAVMVLSTVRAAMAGHSRLLIVERELPDTGPVPFEFVMSDLIMLTMGPGRERTLREYDRLLRRAGLRLGRTADPGGGTGPNILEVSM
jgi:SAM-dependent methyltransferase